jgi:hypothetical protein
MVVDSSIPFAADEVGAGEVGAGAADGVTSGVTVVVAAATGLGVVGALTADVREGAGLLPGAAHPAATTARPSASTRRR